MKADKPAEDLSAKEIILTKQFRQDLFGVLTRLKEATRSRERALAITELQSVIHWLGEDLHERADTNPYPNSMDITNTVVDKRVI